MCCASHAACDQKVDQLAISVLSALAAAIEAGKDMQSVRVLHCFMIHLSANHNMIIFFPRALVSDRFSPR